MVVNAVNFKSISSFIILSFLCACGGGPNPDRDALNNIPVIQNVDGTKFELLSETDSLSFGNGMLAGSGSVRFAESLGSAATNYNFLLNFSLNDGGELSLVTHATQSLTDGVVLKFKRTGATLSVYVTTGNVTDDWSSFFSALNASEPLSIAIDVHNNEPFTHLVFWDEQTNTKLLDSGDDVNGTAGKGFGQSWGLILNNASVSKAKKDPPRDEH
jgi:hypothetical protein